MEKYLINQNQSFILLFFQIIMLSYEFHINTQSAPIAILDNVISMKPVSETNISHYVKNIMYLQISSTV